MEQPERHPALDTLEALVGIWVAEAVFPGDPPQMMKGGYCNFEWELECRYLLQRMGIENSPAPSSLALIAYDPAAGTFTQHYFDSHGVVRLYGMTPDNGVWTLTRERADFSPLPFSQRFRGTFDDGGKTNRGAREKTGEGGTWEHDFDLIYRRKE